MSILFLCLDLTQIKRSAIAVESQIVTTSVVWRSLPAVVRSIFTRCRDRPGGRHISDTGGRPTSWYSMPLSLIPRSISQPRRNSRQSRQSTAAQGRRTLDFPANVLLCCTLSYTDKGQEHRWEKAALQSHCERLVRHCLLYLDQTGRAASHKGQDRFVVRTRSEKHSQLLLSTLRRSACSDQRSHHVQIHAEPMTETQQAEYWAHFPARRRAQMKARAIVAQQQSIPRRRRRANTSNRQRRRWQRRRMGGRT